MSRVNPPPPLWDKAKFNYNPLMLIEPVNDDKQIAKSL